MKKGFSKLLAYIMVFMMLFTMVPAMPAYAETEPASEPAAAEQTENDLELPESEDIDGSNIEDEIIDEEETDQTTEAQTEEPEPVSNNEQDPQPAMTRSTAVAASTTHSHPMCGSSCGCDSAHSAKTWNAWNGTGTLYNNSYYYLTEDIELSSTKVLNTGYTSYLCLNGHSITYKGNVLSIGSNTSLIITDCVGTGKIENTGAGIAAVINGKSLSVWGGTILSSGSQNAIYASTGSTTYINKGNVTANSSEAIYACAGSNIQIKGGTVHGSVYAESDGINIAKVTVSGGTLTTTGNSFVFIMDDGHFNMTGGHIKGGLDIYDSSAVGSTTISGGTIDGRLQTHSSTVSINGGTIGGLHADGDVTISGGKFKGESTIAGSDARISGGDFTLSPTLWLSGETWISGGSFNDIRVQNSPLYLSGVPEIGTLGIQYANKVSAQNPDGTGSYGGDPIDVWFWNYSANDLVGDGDIIVKNVKTDAIAEKFVLTGADAEWNYLERVDNNLVLRAIPHGNWRDNVTWKIVDGTLIIEGEGEITHAYSGSSYPWGDYSDVITKVVVGSGITKIPTYTFERQKNIESITLPDTLEKMDCYAFTYCEKLNNLLIPASLTYIAPNASLNHVDALTDIYYLGTEEEWNNIENVSTLDRTLEGVKLNKHFLEFHEDSATCTEKGVQAYYAFDEGSVYEYYFDSDRNRIYELAETPAKGHSWADATCETPKTCEACGATEDAALGHAWGDWEVTKPATESENGIESRVCSTCGETETKEIPRVETSNKCGENATWTIDADGNLVISGTGAVTDNSGFKNLEINEVVIEEGITEIGAEIFRMSSMQSLAPLPSTLESIGDYAFGNCNVGTELVLPEGLAELGKYAFTNTICASVKLPDSLKVIGDGAFRGSMVSYLTIPEGVTTIGEEAFSWTSLLGDVIIPETVTSIGADAFANADQVECFVILNPECAIDQAGIPTWCKIAGCGRSKAEEYALTLPGKPFVYLCDYYGKDHEFGEGTVVQEPDCINQGITEIVCKNCNMQDYEYTETDSEKHAYGDWEQTVESTCAKEGTESRTCNLCGAVESKEVAKINHSEVIIPAVAATCTNTGLTEGTQCSSCFEIMIAQEVTPKIDHIYGDWKPDVAPTCTNVGSDYRVCDTCGATDTRSVDALGHDYESVVTDPTCTEPGYTTHTCTRCDDSYVDSETEVKSHTGEKMDAVEPTCTSTGLTEGEKCSSCGEILSPQEVIPALPHKYVKSVVRPTCFEEGYTMYVCYECTDTYKGDFVEALGYHPVETWIYTVVPTADREGSREGICTACNQKVYEMLPIDPSVVAAGSCSSNDTVIWEIGTDGKLTISGKGYISSKDWAGYKDQIKSLVIEDGITSIPDLAFREYTELTGHLVLPESITYIGQSAFYGCTGLTGELVLPENLTNISNRAFAGCTGLTGELILPKNLTIIGSGAFSGCTGLTGTLNIPGSVESISSSAFSNCTGITGVKLQYGIKSIENEAFFECKNLKGVIVIPDSVTHLGSFLDHMYSNNIDKVYIPESVNSGNINLPYEIPYYIYEGSYVDEYLKNSAYYAYDIHYIAVSETVKKQTEFMDFRSATIVAGVDEYINLMDYIVSDRELTAADLEVTFSTEDYISYDNGEIYTWDPGECVIAVKNGEHVSSAVLKIIDKSYEKTEAKYIAFNQQKITLEKGEKYYNKPVVLPLNTTNTVMAWSSSDPDIAAVSQKGTVTGVAVGTAEITAKINDAVYATYTVNVDSPLLNIYVMDDYADYELIKGEYENIFFQTYPADARHHVNFISSNEEVVTVDEYGKMTAVDAGEATVMLIGAGKPAVVNVKVGNPVKKISIKEYKQRIAIGDTVQLEMELTPADAVLEAVPVWTSSNTSVATVDENGTVTAVKSGTADITVTVGDFTAITTVYCRNTAMDSVRLEKETMEVAYGQTVALKAMRDPDYTSDTSAFTWKSDNEDVVTVNENGEITGVELGTANVYVVAGDYTDSCEITVTKAEPEIEVPTGLKLIAGAPVKNIKLPEGFEWQHPESSVGMRMTVTFDASYTPEDTEHYDTVYGIPIEVQIIEPKVLSVDLIDAMAVCVGTEHQMESVLDVKVQDDCGYDLIWRIENEEVATLDAAGNLVAVAPGETVIILKIQDDFVENCHLVVNEHRWSASYTIDKKPTCTETGSESIHCTDCGAIKPETSRDIAAREHSYTEWIVSVEPTVESDGEKYKECVSCGDVIKEVLPACIAYGELNAAIKWIILPDGTLKISGTGKLEQSEVLNEYRTQITGLIIEDGITEIGDSAFQDFGGVKNDLVIPDSVTAIGDRAFALTVPGTVERTLTLSKNLETIGSEAFAGNSNLKGELIIPDGVTTIGANAFSDCKGFTGDLVIPDSVTAIGDSAFSNCIGLDGTLTLSNELETIGAYAFRYCEFTGDLVIPDSVTVIDAWAFNTCGFDGTLTLSDNLTTIGSYIFYGCDGFKGDLVIPDSVTKIESLAFWECGFDGTLTLSKNLETIGSSAFYECSFKGDLVVPDSVIAINDSAFSCSGFDGTLTLPQNLTSIDAGVFNSCGFTGELIIPDSVTTIGDRAFSQCTSLTGDLVIPDSVTAIGNSAFDTCNKFNGELKLSKNLKKINDGVFSGCGFTGELIIPENVTAIGNNAFTSCYRIESITLSENLKTIEDYAFAYCDNLRGNLVIPDSVTTIGDGAFGAMNTDTYGGTLTLSENLTAIGDSAFNTCGFTGTLVIPDCVTSIGSVAFGGCYKITDIVIKGKELQIGNNAFNKWQESERYYYIYKDSAVEAWIDANKESGDVVQYLDEHGNLEGGHAWKDATCDAPKTCRVCGATEGEALGHSWIDATCETPATCERCGVTEGKALGHDLSEVTVESTCQKQGYTGRACNRCDFKLVDSYEPVVDHKYGEWYEISAPTCESWGDYRRECIYDGCNQYESNMSEPLGHKGEWIKEKIPTCVESGFESRICEACGVKETNIIFDYENHTWTDATCANASMCTACGKTKGEPLPHNIKHNPAIECTCVQRGMEENWYCSGCDTYFANEECTVSFAEAPYYGPSEHVYSSEYTVDKAATTAEAGSKSRHCENCDAKTDVTAITKLGTVTLSTTKYVYNGNSKKPSVTVKDVSGETIGTGNYTVSYASGRTKVGRYKVTVTFKGDYTGTKNVYFTVVPKKPSSASAALSTTTTPSSSRYDDIKFSWKASTGASGYLVYYKKGSGSWSKAVATKSTYYTKKNLSDGAKYTFKVVPYYLYGSTKYYDTAQYRTATAYTLKKLSAPTVTKSGTKVKVKWKNISGESGYQISRSTSKSGTSVVATYATTSGTYKTVSATKGKKYYYRVRAYKKVGSKTVYGPWSEPKLYTRK